MAIYHFSLQIIGRSKGKSSVAAAAYRSGEKLIDNRTGLEHDYTRKSGIVYTEIMAPAESPSWINNREQLWNEVERAERRKDSQLAREINIALPKELNQETQIALAREFVQDTFVNNGMVADVCIHDLQEGNPHMHIMLTMRDITCDGFGKKNREWNDKEVLEGWREQWANHANRALSKEGFTERIDHRSFEEQGIEKIPQIHVGVHASAMEKKGIETERGSLNREIKEFNNKQVVELNEYKELRSKLQDEINREESKYKYLNSEEKTYISKVEGIIGTVASHENVSGAIQKIIDTKENESYKLRALEIKERALANKIDNIGYTLKQIESAELNLKGLKKNIFGQYKDKAQAKVLMDTISNNRALLDEKGYKSHSDLIRLKNELQELREEGVLQQKYVNKIDNTKDTAQKALRAMENQEIREVYQMYYKEFKQAENWSYDDVKAIKSLNEFANRTFSVKDIKELYVKGLGKIKAIEEELHSIGLHSDKLNRASEALKVIEKNQSIIDKWETKIFGKEKYQKDHWQEKNDYDNAKRLLNECNVKDRMDLSVKENHFNSMVKARKLELIDKNKQLASKVSLLENAVKAINKAEQIDKAREINSMNRNSSKTINKSFDMDR